MEQQRVPIFIDRLHPIASGSNTKVYRASGVNNEQYAVKVVNLVNMPPKYVHRARQEVDLLKELSGHPNIIKTHCVYEENNSIYIVMDYIKTDLLTYLTNFENGLPETETCILFKQLVQVIQFLHSKKIVHGDIKLENILYDQKTQTLALIDFGSASRVISKKEKLQHISGTPQYVAPEVILREEYNGFKADIYSLGVVLFGLSTNRLPFHDEDGVYYYSWVENYHEALLHPSVRILPSTFLSRPLLSLIKKLLSLNPSLRGNLKEIISHPWIKKSLAKKTHGSRLSNLKQAISSIFN